MTPTPTSPGAENQTRCDYCGKLVARKHPLQRFCSPRRAGQRKCKDRYHNREAFNSRDIRSDFERYADSVHSFSSEAFGG